MTKPMSLTRLTRELNADPIPHRRSCPDRNALRRYRITNSEQTAVRCEACEKYAVVTAEPGDEKRPEIADPRNATTPVFKPTFAPQLRDLAARVERLGIPLLVVDATDTPRIVRRPADLDGIRLRRPA